MILALLLACSGDVRTRLAQTDGSDDGSGGSDSAADTGTSAVDDTAGDSGGDSGGTRDSGDSGGSTDSADSSGGDTDSAADSGTAGPTCGDGTCDAEESCWSCAGDCGSCDCPEDVEVIIYDQSAWSILADAFLADPSPCADYYLSLPALSDDKTQPRSGGDPETLRAHGPRIHALAEFHWSGWSGVSGSWYDKGVEFRRRMDAAGYDVAAGDAWEIDELPSTVRSDDATRADAIDAMRGLYDGPKGSPPVQGVVFTTGMGQDTTNFSVYKPYLEDWLSDADFWAKANLYARWWAQEVYADPSYTCVPGTTVADRSSHLNAYVEHVADLAVAGPSDANTAQSYLNRAYVPMMNAVWGSDGNGYGDTLIDLDQMEHHVSGEVYAARSWSNDHDFPDGRLGFAWARMDVSDDDLATLAARLASAIHYAYDEGGGAAAYACSPSGAYTWCQCSVDGAAFNEGWDTFSSW